MLESALMLETRSHKKRSRDIVVTSKANIDVPCRARLLGIKLHSNTPDDGVWSLALRKHLGKLLESIFFCRIDSQTHGGTPYHVKSKTRVQTLLNLSGARTAGTPPSHRGKSRYRRTPLGTQDTSAGCTSKATKGYGVTVCHDETSLSPSILKRQTSRVRMSYQNDLENKAPMNAGSTLKRILRAMRIAGIEGILVGNAGAALQGAPVTTDDFDFLFRPTRKNRINLKVMAAELDAVLTQPQYPLSRFYRMLGKGDLLQVDMMVNMDGVKSFESLRSRSIRSKIGDEEILVADLRDIIKSKKAAGRPKDKAVLLVLENTLRAKTASETTE